jgi:hypothetical protein
MESSKEVDVQESQLIREWTAEAREQARLETLRALLLRQAANRFNGALTDEDRQMISKQDSSSVLDEWLDAVVQATDYAAFRAVLRR